MADEASSYKNQPIGSIESVIRVSSTYSLNNAVIVRIFKFINDVSSQEWKIGHLDILS